MTESNVSPSLSERETGFFTSSGGEIRLGWVFIIIPIYILGALIISRVIFKIIQTQIFISEGFSQTLASDLAQAEMMSLEVQAVLGVIDFLLMFLLVYVLLVKAHKQEFSWSSLGLDIKKMNVAHFILGSFLGFMLIIITRGVGLVTGSIQIQTLNLENLFTQANVKFMIYFYIWAILNGFWQEIVFRGYLQTRVTNKINPIIGIPAVTIYFVLVHFIDRQLDLYWVIAMTFLFIMISLVYHYTNSLFLVGAIHGSINYFDQVVEVAGVTWIAPATNHWIANSLLLGLLLGFYLLIQYIRTRIPVNGL